MTLPALEDPRRLHYLDAMGLSAWTARYRLPNAAPTPTSEWQTQVAPVPQAPAQRLHALLDEPAPSRTTPSKPKPDQDRPVSLQEFRRRISPAQEKRWEGSEEAPVEAEKRVAKFEPLRFTLQLGALEGRWLVVMAQDDPPSSLSMRFLQQLLFAASIPAILPALQTFRWPLMDELPVEEPLVEAREGLEAFLAGRKRDGWNIERLLIFGESPSLARVLTLDDGKQEFGSSLLALPAWQVSSLETLMQSADAKRALWPMLGEWRRQWRISANGNSSDA
ncbi:hypothetical protein FGL86_06425 [Pistricoccus aurantiacus]|uniref:Energy transducer TonB n=1 Tax=Pistricoccus aurantiacus TaxID=1883414 RepID=A0A5B8SPU9_9GAMM|nr:hypothetical protein [Pistricoccus aurantiacus]QEA38746.1 hypothetical protein FGL86_06425 [Pistricoccus aurantiacus]